MDLEFDPEQHEGEGLVVPNALKSSCKKEKGKGRGRGRERSRKTLEEATHVEDDRQHRAAEKNCRLLISKGEREVR